jgi:hypothetical protein
MTTSATAPDLTDSEVSDSYASYIREFNEAIERGVWEHYAEPAGNSQSTQLLIQPCVIRAHPGTADYEVTLIQYGGDSNAIVVVDFGESTSEFPKEHREIIKLLRDNGRPILAGKLITMLRNVNEDPDKPTISIFSLRDMARLLIEHGEYADPFIGPDRRGIIHAQWRIIGNGVLVVSFLGYGEILLVAQADESPNEVALDVSSRGPEQEILEEFGRLVPRRN